MLCTASELGDGPHSEVGDGAGLATSGFMAVAAFAFGVGLVTSGFMAAFLLWLFAACIAFLFIAFLSTKGPGDTLTFGAAGEGGLDGGVDGGSPPRCFLLLLQALPPVSCQWMQCLSSSGASWI